MYLKQDINQRRKEHLWMKAEEEKCISEEARMDDKEEKLTQLMAEEEMHID